MSTASCARASRWVCLAFTVMPHACVVMNMMNMPTTTMTTMADSKTSPSSRFALRTNALLNLASMPSHLVLKVPLWRHKPTGPVRHEFWLGAPADHLLLVLSQDQWFGGCRLVHNLR